MTRGRLWQARPLLASIDELSGNAKSALSARLRGGAGHGDLAGGGVHQLAAGELLDQIGIDGAGAHQRDAMLEALALGTDLVKLLVADTELGLRVLKREHAARTPDGVIAEIGRDRARHRRQHHGGKYAGHTSPDSHHANESPTDSGRQGKMG